MKRVLMVDDDEALRKLVRIRLSDTYEVVDTGDPKQALALALEYKPDAILLDLMMPQFNGFELCQSFKSLSYTSLIPIFVISGGGEARVRYEQQCDELGATAYFEKPIDFINLRAKLAAELHQSRPERRRSVRLRMRIPMKLTGKDAGGLPFEELTSSDDVSAHGFQCSCSRTLVKGCQLEVFLVQGTARYVGRASVVREDLGGTSGHRYGFQFDEKTPEWILHENNASSLRS
jgi:DNA-binding response OmpR family regulator